MNQAVFFLLDFENSVNHVHQPRFSPAGSITGMGQSDTFPSWATSEPSGGIFNTPNLPNRSGPNERARWGIIQSSEALPYQELLHCHASSAWSPNVATTTVCFVALARTLDRWCSRVEKWPAETVSTATVLSKSSHASSKHSSTADPGWTLETMLARTSICRLDNSLTCLRHSDMAVFSLSGLYGSQNTTEMEN